MDEEMALFLFIIIQGPEESEDEMLTMKITYNAHLAAPLLITGGDVERRLHNERQNPTQIYLNRPQLQPNTGHGVSREAYLEGRKAPLSKTGNGIVGMRADEPYLGIGRRLEFGRGVRTPPPDLRFRNLLNSAT